ncbi:MAG: HAMP domain-containing sensor histidine kinase [Gemmatimonadota bacterium]
MTFRARLFTAFTAASVLPLALLAYGVRHEMGARLTSEYEQRVRAAAAEVQDALSSDAAAVSAALAALAHDLASDNRFRLAQVQQDEGERRWLLDLAGERMRAGGLALLRIQDSAGRILSSGQFRNEFDQAAPEIPRALASAAPAITVAQVRTAGGSLLAVVRADSFTVTGQRFTLVGGRIVDSISLAHAVRGRDLGVMLTTGSDTLLRAGAGGAGIGVSETAIGYVAATGSLRDARLVITRSPGTLDAIRRGIDRWTLAALALTLLLAMALAAALAARVSRPLARLAEQTAALDLDRLDQQFATDGDDEIGALSRLLAALTDRLRTGTVRLRDAERRAAFGDVARQVNHDVKNGLAPIRHVVRHLGEVARDEPDRLALVFAERRGTLDSSVDYLETLARNYARLAPNADASRCDLNAVARQVAANLDPARATVRLELAPALPPVMSDPVALRRIVENLAGNAVDSLAGRAGGVTFTTSHANGAASLTVADTGRGMSREELARAFDDFYTTKSGGTGLGLSVVRRLVADLGGTLRVETEPGAGSRFTVDVPAGGTA